MLNDQSITSPHNEPQRSPGFVQKQSPEVFCKKGVLKTFENFTGKHLRWSLNVAGLQASNFIKKIQKQPSECSVKRAALKNFAIFTGKHLCRSRFLLKL